MNQKIYKNDRIILKFGDNNLLEFMSGAIIRNKYNDLRLYLSLDQIEDNKIILYDTSINFIKIEDNKLVSSLNDLLFEYNWIKKEDVEDVGKFIGIEINNSNFNTIEDLIYLFTSFVQFYGVDNFSLDRELYSLSEAKKLLRMY